MITHTAQTAYLPCTNSLAESGMEEFTAVRKGMTLCINSRSDRHNLVSRGSHMSMPQKMVSSKCRHGLSWGPLVGDKEGESPQT